LADRDLLSDALAIWHAGLAAVRSDRLVREAMHLDGSALSVGEEEIPLAEIRRIAIVGAGKAGGGMAAAVEEVLGTRICREKQVAGWVNVPADCLRALKHIHLHSARPAGVNEPTPEGAAGAEEILRIVAALGPHDLCLCLLSGGGSALLPAPVEAISLEDKLAVTRFLSAAGANIEQLNTVRKQLSRIKGGGLARACRAGRLISLIISDVPGDPLDLIASGPTVEDTSTPTEALGLLRQFARSEADIPAAVLRWFSREANQSRILRKGTDSEAHPTKCRVTNLIVGNNATAVDAAGVEAERRGYSHAMICAREPEGQSEDVGRHLAAMARQMRDSHRAEYEAKGTVPFLLTQKSGQSPDCLISGGEPVVRLVEAPRRGRGGRNQQLALAALEAFWDDGGRDVAFLSGGTDGEDGPTDAAGAFFDAEIVKAASEQGLVPHGFLVRNDAYSFFAPLDALLKTGPTQTNVGDVRVIVTRRSIAGVP
jgi:glycerate 2-kinase